MDAFVAIYGDDRSFRASVIVGGVTQTTAQSIDKYVAANNAIQQFAQRVVVKDYTEPVDSSAPWPRETTLAGLVN